MLEKMSTYVVDDILYKGQTLEEDQREIMLFGVTRILEDIPKYLAIIAICTFMNVLKELSIVILVTVLYKGFVGGAHARTNLICFITSTIFFLTPIFVPRYLTISGMYMYLLYALVIISSIYVIVRIVPGDTEEVPILKKNRRKAMKIKAMLSFLTLIFAEIFIINDVYLSQIMLIAILMTNIFVSSKMYKILRCKHSYESEEYKMYYNT